MNTPHRLIVTGMHRSGTSLVASLLASWKVKLGDQLLPADRDNPRGYFEDVEFLALNRRILTACTLEEEGHRDWGWTESEALDFTQLPQYHSAATALVNERDAAGSDWGWKDPRTSLLLDFWSGVLGEDARYLLVYRKPWEVADSMMRTGAAIWLTHPDYPQRIWRHYNRRLLAFHQRNRERSVLVSTNRLLGDPEGFAALMRERFGIDADARTLASLQDRSSFVTQGDADPLPQLWRHVNREAMELLGALDDAADLGNDRAWERAAVKSFVSHNATPRIAVVIPCHDDGDYVIEAVASVQRNTHEGEIIIVDDGSTQQRTLDVLAALRAAGLRVIEQPQAGVAAARNSGIAASTAEYVLPLDADNRILPGFLDEAMAVLHADPGAGVVYGDRREFGVRNEDVTVPELDLPRMLWSNYIDACAVMRREVWNDCQHYDETFTDWEDWDFWLTAAERGWRFVRLPRPAFEYRVRPDSLHQRFLRRSDYPSTLLRLYAKHGELVSMHAVGALLAGHIERRRLFDDTRALLASRDAIQAEIDRTEQATRTEITALRNTIVAAETELASIKPILAARDQELASVKEVLAAHDEELASVAGVLAARDEELASVAGVLAARDEELASVSEVLAARDEELTSVAGLLAARDEELASVKEVLAARDEELTSVKEVLAARDEELTSTRAALEERSEELMALRTLQPGETIEAAPKAERALTNATTVFTIVARNYLAYARVLAASVERHNPGTRLQVVVLDDDGDRNDLEDGGPAREKTAEANLDIIDAVALPFDAPSDFQTMAATYDVTELATAVKPFAFQFLFERGAEVVIYLDPDIVVFDTLGPLEELTSTKGMVLTPHITEPLPRDGKRPDENDLLTAGIYNLGFLALSATVGQTFLPWWQARLKRDCLNDPLRGLFVDQRWLDFAPALFEPFILKDPGYNVAYWNLPHRTLERQNERILVNGSPLRFFHFSGFSAGSPHLLSKHQHTSLRINLNREPLLSELCSDYAAALQRAGFASSSKLAYRYAATADDLPLDARTRKALRRTYVEDEETGARVFPDPFSAEGADDVVERLNRPSPFSRLVPAYLGEIWSERADLRVAFPRIDSVDAERFLDWVRTQGVREHDIPAQLIPPGTPETDPARPEERKLMPGVNVYGYAFAESGTGQIVRSVVAALAAEGIPYAVVPFTRTLSRQQRDFKDLGAEPSFDTNLICVNADQVPVFFENMQSHLLPGARNIGLWAWEVEELPAAMAASERYLDEVWGISSYTAAALERSLTKPVRAFPLPVEVPRVERRTRAELGMPEGFLFLFCFDYDSVFRRKNPLAIVAAFREAFGDQKDVVLYIKTTNAGRHPAESEALQAAVRSCRQIVVRDAYVTSSEYFSMLDSCDCYVSLHRSEGFGLTVAEAMALGKPVISTAYSSTLEFTNDSNSYLVSAPKVRVGPDAAPYAVDSHWSEPDVAIAAEQMRRVYLDREGAAAKGERARTDIETLHTPQARGPLLRELLEQNRSGRKTSLKVETVKSGETQLLPANHVQPSGADASSTFDSDVIRVEALLGSPRADLPSRMQRIATPLRQLALRFMRVYWVQQLAVDRALLAAMRALRRESRSENASITAMLREQRDAQERTVEQALRMREELQTLSQQVRTLSEQLGTMESFATVQKLEEDEERIDS